MPAGSCSRESSAGNHKVQPARLRLGLGPRCGIDHVAHVDDLPSTITDFRCDDLAYVYAGPKRRHYAVAILVAGARVLNGVSHRKVPGDASTVRLCIGHRPGDDDLVADILVDITFELEQRFFQFFDEFLEQRSVANWADPFRDSGGVDQVQEEKDALLLERSRTAGQTSWRST